MALAEQKARTFRRAVVNKAKNFTAIEAKVREATSNDPWGPETTLLHEIADASYNVVAFGEIMGVLWKRINDDGKNWRHVMKSLSVLECLVKTGCEKCAEQCKKNIYAIETLSTFQYIDKDGKDMGNVVREKAKNLVALLKDDERLKSERQKALKLREKMNATTIWSLSSTGQRNITSGTSWRPTYQDTSDGGANYSSGASAAQRANLNPDMENALPSDPNEEELQLQLALALSKEEADQEESQRKNAEIRYKMALEESKKETSSARKEASSNSDLLSLSFNKPTGQETLREQAQRAAAVNPQDSLATAFDPWGHAGQDNGIEQLAAPPSNDPFGELPLPVRNDSLFDTGSEPVLVFEGGGRGMPAPLIPSTSNQQNSNISDMWENGPMGESPPARHDSPTRKAAHSLLGDHANLVNFDNLISASKPPSNTGIFPSNPFNSAAPVRGNPFQPAKVAQPSINELRNQQAQQALGGDGASTGQSSQAAFIQPTMSMQQPLQPVVPAFPAQFSNSPPSVQSQQPAANNAFNPFR